MATVLLEIGTEELPAGYLPAALAQLATLTRSAFEEARIPLGELRTWGTPRRLAIFITNVAEQQAPAVREIRGPAAHDAFASNGEPTQAAIGFARSQGLGVNDLRIKNFDGAEYVTAVFREEGRPTAELCPAIFPQLITGLTFPKTMRWGDSKLRFARPVRWLVALLNEEVIPFAIDEVTAGRITRGHRFLAADEIAIPSAADYPRLLEENLVLVDQQARLKVIHDQLAAITAQDNATILDDGALLEETVFSVEYPTAVRGTLDGTFLALPPVVLQQVLYREQKCFPLADAHGRLLPLFIAVRDGDKAFLSTVRDGYERVMRAKLLDALFFFEQDRRQTLAQRVESLRGVVFQERLGTLYNKARRVETLAGLIAAWLNFPTGDRLLAERAGLLAKADLVTDLVTEHPGLQGAIGRVYALLSGEPEALAVAIGEQYQPRSAGEPIPGSPLGRALALADKVDTVVAGFAVGLMPVGTEDTYGLRQDALGAVRILAEAGYPLRLSTLITHALNLVADTVPPTETMRQALDSFFRRQVDALLEAAGVDPIVARWVLAPFADQPSEMLPRGCFLQAHLADETLLAVARIAARLANLTKNFPGDSFYPELLQEPAERELVEQYNLIAPQVTAAAAKGDFAALLAALHALLPSIERFLSEVTIMVEDPELRQTRLVLVWRLSSLFKLLGDLSLLAV